MKSKNGVASPTHSALIRLTISVRIVRVYGRGATLVSRLKGTSSIVKLFVEGYPKENLFGFFGFFSNLVAGLFSFSGNKKNPTPGFEKHPQNFVRLPYRACYHWPAIFVAAAVSLFAFKRQKTISIYNSR